MTPQELLKRAHVRISMDPVFCAYSAILACGDTVVSTDHGPTACTDGWTKWYNPKFLSTLTEPEIRGLVLHEATHAAYQHLRVWQDLWNTDARLANIAMDHFVNLALMDTDAGRNFIAIPKVGIQPDPQYRGMNVKQIFDKLKQDPPPQPQKPTPQGGEGEPDDADQPSEANGEGQGEGCDSHDWQGAQRADAEQMREQAKEIERAVRQGETIRKKRGQGAGDANGVFGELMTPKIDWRRMLREFIQTHCADRQESTWRKPNRRYLADDVYMPSMQGRKLDTLLIGFDTSGSCFGTEDMTLFVSELTAIIGQTKPATIHIVYCDWEVQGHQTFKDGQFAVQSLQPRGGGGTDLTKIFTYAKEENIKPTAAVILTDGETPYPAQAAPFPTLWAINTKAVAPWGVTVHIE